MNNFEVIPIEDLTAEQYIEALRIGTEILDPSYKSFAIIWKPTGSISHLTCIPIEEFELSDE